VVGDGLNCDGEDLVFECSDVAGTGLNCFDSNIILVTTGDWTGTLDTYQGADLLNWDLFTNKPPTSTILALLDSDYRIAKLYASTTEMSTASSTQWQGGGLADCDTAATSKLL